MPAPAPHFELHGTVARGDGVARHFTTIDWVVDAFRTRLGFVPHPGTFNLRVEPERARAVRARLAAAAGIAIAPPAGFCAAKCFPVRVGGRVAGALVLPATPGYPDDKFEIVAPVPVRETLGLADGDRVVLRIHVGRGVPMRIVSALDARGAPAAGIACPPKGERS